MTKKTVKATLNKVLKFKGKSYTTKTLAHKLNVKGEVEISTEKTWFSEAMEKLDKQGK